jgi:hypothetical protein
MMFRLGQKVVCVDDDIVGKNPTSIIPPHLPKLHQVYTVRGFIKSDDGREFVYLCEIVNPIRNNHEPAFAPFRFRPIVERKTDISFAHEILRKANAPEFV